MTVIHLVALAEVGGCEINCLRLIRALPHCRHVVFVLGGNGPMVPRWKEAGATVHLLDVLRLNSLNFTRRLRARAKAGDFTGTVLYWSNARLFWVWRAIAGSVSSLTVYLGNPYGSGWKGRFRDRLYMLAAPSLRGLRLIACSEAVAASFRTVPFWRCLPVAVLPNPVEPIEPKIAHRSLGRDNAIRLGMVARLDKIKDHATVIRAMRGILADFPNASLELAGDGLLRSELEELARKEGVSHVVKFLGSVMDVPALLREWDVFIYGTTVDEGMGSAVAEALMAGLPVVASDIPVMREVCGGTAEYFTAGDPRDLAAKVVRLVGDVDRRSALGRAARTWALRRYAPKAIAEGYLAESFDFEEVKTLQRGGE